MAVHVRRQLPAARPGVRLVVRVRVRPVARHPVQPVVGVVVDGALEVDGLDDVAVPVVGDGVRDARRTGRGQAGHPPHRVIHLRPVIAPPVRDGGGPAVVVEGIADGYS